MIDFISILLWVAFLVCPVIALLFVLRLLIAAFSGQVSEEFRRYPVFHTIWGCLAAVGVFTTLGVTLGVMGPDMWPPRSVERRRQRAEVLHRIQGAGGWAALQRDCDALVEQYRGRGAFWGDDTNALPPTIAALKPRSVIVSWPTLQGDFKDEIPVIRIKVFGSKSTGGRSTLYFGLEVVCATNAESYRPDGGASGNRYDYNRVSDRIYETY